MSRSHGKLDAVERSAPADSMIVHVYHNPSGARLFAEPMVTRLNQAGLATELWCDGGECPWLGGRARTRADTPCRYIPSDLSLNPFRTATRVVRLTWALVRARPQVVHAHLMRSSTLPLLAACLARVPRRVYHNHGLAYLGHRRPMRYVLRTVERVNRRLATHVLMVSRSTRESAIDDGLGDATVLASGSAVGVDASYFRDHHHEGEPCIRHELAIPASAVVFGFAGRPVAHKGLTTLVRAWDLARLADQGGRLLLAGVTDTHLRRLVKRVPPGMLCLGPLAEMRRFYAACDVMVLPSWYEGFGNVLLEGAAAELPGIGSDVSGIRCAIDPGVTGLLVPPRDPAALASAMRRLVHEPPLRRQMGAAARRRVLDGYTSEHVLGALLSYYRNDVLVEPPAGI